MTLTPSIAVGGNAGWWRNLAPRLHGPDFLQLTAHIVFEQFDHFPEGGLVPQAVEVRAVFDLPAPQHTPAAIDLLLQFGQRGLFLAQQCQGTGLGADPPGVDGAGQRVRLICEVNDGAQQAPGVFLLFGETQQLCRRSPAKASKLATCRRTPRPLTRRA